MTPHLTTDKKDSVAAKHPHYDGCEMKRTIFRDVCAGTLTLREKHREYLPKFPAEHDEDYKTRCSTATCFNLTEKTRNVMSGLVFKESITIGDDVSTQIVPLLEDIDNAGTHFDVFARRAFDASFEGCSLILVDAPNVIAESLEEERALNLRPYWVLYRADAVWNWRFVVNPVSKRKELSLLVLREVTDEPSGDFVSETVTRFRVFRLVEGMVTVELWREVRRGHHAEPEYILEQPARVVPRLTMIPVGVVGTLGGDPPLLDIALKNLEHFQTYSDYKSLVHKTCVPIPVFKDLQMPEGEEFVINGSTGVEVGKDGDMFWSEVAASSLEMIRQTLQDNRDEIALLGLSLLADKDAKVDVTATEALLNNIGETAELRVMARSLQDALELCLGHTAEYLGLPRTEGGSIELGAAWNTQRDEFTMNLEELNIKADIANKLQTFVPPDALMELVGLADTETARDWMERIAQLDAIVVEEPEEEDMAVPV